MGRELHTGAGAGLGLRRGEGRGCASVDSSGGAERSGETWGGEGGRLRDTCRAGGGECGRMSRKQLLNGTDEKRNV